MKKTTHLIVSTFVLRNDQYEQYAITVIVHHTTERGLMRRARQLSRDHSFMCRAVPDWINASVAIASDDDIWADDGFDWCQPANGWLDLD